MSGAPQNYGQAPYDPNAPLVQSEYNSSYQPPQMYQQQAPYGGQYAQYPAPQGQYAPPPQGYVAAPGAQAYPYGAPPNTAGPLVVPTFRKIMSEDFCGCFEDITSCLFSVFLPACLAGNNYELTGQGSCVIGCCCYPFMSGCYRSGVQRTLGVADSGCLLNCCIHIYLRPCALTQEARAIKDWVNCGRPAAVPGHMVM